MKRFKSVGFLIAVNPKQPVLKPCVVQGWFAPKMLQQERNVRSSRTCQRGDWMCRVRRVQAVPGQGGWLPVCRHVNRSCSEITHCWIAWGDQGYIYRLTSVWDSPCPISGWRSMMRRGTTCPAAWSGQDSAGNKLGQKSKGSFISAWGVEKDICSHLLL